MSARIPLRRKDGSVRAWAIVDDADFEDLSAFRWSLVDGYAVRNLPRVGRRPIGGGWSESMARRIVGLERGDARRVDHIDRVRLNNQRSNLRILTAAANYQNVVSRPGASSSYRGVTWNARDRRWHARARVDGHVHHLGYFVDEHEAGAVAAEWRRVNMPYSSEAAGV